MRQPCCDKQDTNKGAWSKQEDQKLIDYIRTHGEGCWRSMPKAAGLLRCGKSCRLRWINYLRPDLKRGNFGQDEEDLIIKLHALLGNRWSLIAGRLPGRTDNEVKNYWNSHIKRKLVRMGIDPSNHRLNNGISNRIQPPATPPRSDDDYCATTCPPTTSARQSDKSKVIAATCELQTAFKLSSGRPNGDDDGRVVNNNYKAYNYSSDTTSCLEEELSSTLLPRLDVDVNLDLSISAFPSPPVEKVLDLEKKNKQVNDDDAVVTAVSYKEAESSSDHQDPTLLLLFR